MVFSAVPFAAVPFAAVPFAAVPFAALQCGAPSPAPYSFSAVFRRLISTGLSISAQSTLLTTFVARPRLSS